LQKISAPLRLSFGDDARQERIRSGLQLVEVIAKIGQRVLWHSVDSANFVEREYGFGDRPVENVKMFVERAIQHLVYEYLNTQKFIIDREAQKWQEA